MSEAMQPIIQVKDLHISIKMDEGLLTPVRGVDFVIHPGETLGLVGESGCGKSLTSKAILGINEKKCEATGQMLFQNDDGEVIDLHELPLPEKGRHCLRKLRAARDKCREVKGKNRVTRWMHKKIVAPTVQRMYKRAYRPYSDKYLRHVRGKQISMIFQEPMVAFSPMYTIGNQINEATRLHITKDKRKSKQITLDMMKMVGIANAEKRYDQYPHEFSGGMLQRALIAMALVCRPRLLIADEPTTALDVTIQAQILEIMQELQKELGMAILFITHDLGTVAKMCDRVAVMYLGKIVETGTAMEIYKNPQHPYTKGLMGSVHKIGTLKQDKLFSIEGTVPLALNLKPGCGFYERCGDRIEGVCNVTDPVTTCLEGTHCVACHRCCSAPRKEDFTND